MKQNNINPITKKPKIIIHACADMGSDSKPYFENGYDVRLVGSDIGIENFDPPENVYGIIANPECTEFSFAKSNSKYPRDMKKGMFLVKECLRVIWECQYNLPTPLAKRTNLKFWMLENPFGLLRRYLGHPALIYNPYEYGDPYQKKTCVWGFFNLPEKKYVDKECMTIKQIEKNKSNSKQSISPSGKPFKKFNDMLDKEIHYKGNEHLSRQERRSICSPAFAKAFFLSNR